MQRITIPADGGSRWSAAVTPSAVKRLEAWLPQHGIVPVKSKGSVGVHLLDLAAMTGYTISYDKFGR